MRPEQASQVLERATCLYQEAEIEAVLDNMASAITKRLGADNPILTCVMNGGLITAGKLATRLNFPLEIDYLHVSRYRDKTSGGEFQWHRHPQASLKGRVALIVDDILDEGATLDHIVSYYKQQGCKEVYVAVLVDKLHDHKLASIEADFVGVQAHDEYLVGYGMDYKGYLRNAQGIYAIAAQDCD